MGDVVSAPALAGGKLYVFTRENGKEVARCLDAATGKKVWHYQLVHHGLWDYDPPAAPNLIDISVGGKRIKAVAQPTKQAFLYVFDRVSGEPVWPIEERPVPQSSVPGERASKTQPVPTRPAAFDLQGAREIVGPVISVVAGSLMHFDSV